jgi:hypothetical protein
MRFVDQLIEDETEITDVAGRGLISVDDDGQLVGYGLQPNEPLDSTPRQRHVQSLTGEASGPPHSDRLGTCPIFPLLHPPELDADEELQPEWVRRKRPLVASAYKGRGRCKGSLRGTKTAECSISQRRSLGGEPLM